MHKNLLSPKPLVLNWFDANGPLTQAVADAIYKAKLTMRTENGFKQFELIQFQCNINLRDA